MQSNIVLKKTLNILKNMKTLNSIATKVITITIEGTESEWISIIEGLREYNGYGAIEDLEAIICAQVGEPANDEIMVANEK